MRILRNDESPDAFFARVAAAPDRALLLDYDGTLAPFHEQRNAAVPYPGVREVLEGLIAQERSRVVVISGRATADLKPLLGLKHAPELWGNHGWERLLPDGTYHIAELPPHARAALDGATAMLRADHDPAGWEIKPASVAVHQRGVTADCFHAQSDAMLKYWEDLPDRTGLELHPFDGGVELRVLGRDKGHAVSAVLDEMRCGTVAAFLGDDRTDEDAFAALAGRGLSVLVRPQLRDTAADWWLLPPEELLWFLGRWRDACESNR